MPVPASSHLDRLQALMRSLAAGVDSARLLQEVAVATSAGACGATALVVRVSGGQPLPVAVAGVPPEELMDVVTEAVRMGRLVHRRLTPAGAAASKRLGRGAVAAAIPLRSGGRVIGALAAAGVDGSLDPTALTVYADVTAVALGSGTGVSSGDVPAWMDTLAELGQEMDGDRLAAQALLGAERLFGARAGWCARVVHGNVRIAAHRGLDTERLRDVSRNPQFRALLDVERPSLISASSPSVVELFPPAEVGAVMPITVEGQRVGQLALFLPGPPDGPTQALLGRFATHVGLALRAADLARQVGEAGDQLAAVVHSMASPVIVADESGRLVVVNGAASELFRLAGAFALGLPVTGRLGSEVLEGYLTGDRDGAAEVPIDTETGTRLYRATGRRVRTADGQARGRVLVLDDITADREAEQLKDDFIAVIGHELRTPLTVMKGYIHALGRPALSDERRAQALAALKANSARLERLIGDLLFISAIEQRQMKLDLEVCDLGALVDERATDRVVIQRPRRPLEVAADRVKLGQVLFHLLDNAQKYSDDEVILELIDHGDHVEIGVIDHGPGIFSGDIPNLFERFRQLDGTATRTHGGIGMGLYLSRRLVEAQGGRIWCDSRLGVGSRFAFTLPKDGPGPVSSPGPWKVDHQPAST